jgi:hypothetical protein
VCQGHVARLVLLRVEDFKRRYHVGTPDPLIEKQHALSAEFALLESEDEMHNFLKNQFELEDRQVKQFRKVFSKWDVEGRGEISVSDLTGAVASCGAKLHPQILKVCDCAILRQLALHTLHSSADAHVDAHVCSFVPRRTSHYSHCTCATLPPGHVRALAFLLS